MTVYHVYVSSTRGSYRPSASATMADVMDAYAGARHAVARGMAVLAQVNAATGSYGGERENSVRLTFENFYGDTLAREDVEQIARELAYALGQESALVVDATHADGNGRTYLRENVSADSWTQLAGIGQPRYTYVLEHPAVSLVYAS